MPHLGPIGRDTELRSIAQAVERAHSGRAQVLVLSGEAGSGKTTILGGIAPSLPDDALLLRASGHAAETAMPYAGIHQLLAPVADMVRGLPDPHRAPLTPLVGVADGAAADALSTASALLALVTGIAETRTVVIVIDDAQLLDPSTRQALVFLVRRVDADAVCVVIGVRSEDAHEFTELGVELTVGPLDEADARALLRRHHPDLSAIVVARVIEQAAGNPLALVEIPAELGADQRAGRQPLPRRFPLGRTTELLYRKRLDALGDDERMALLLACFDDLEPVRLSEVLIRCSLSLAHFDRAERMKLVRIVDGRCQFTHPAVRGAVQHAATARELATAHAVLAHSFVEDPIRRAFHLQAVPDADDATVAEALVDAARHAMQQGGYLEPADAFAAASRRTGDDARRREWRAEAITCYLRSAAGPQASALVLDAIDAATTDTERARWWTTMVVLSMWANAEPIADLAQLLALGQRLVENDDDTAASVGTELLLAVTTRELCRGDYGTAKATVDALRAVVPIDELRTEQQLTCDVVDVVVGAPGAGELLRSNWVEAFDWNRIADPGVPVGFFGVALGWIGQIEACARVAEQCRSAFSSQTGFAAAQLAVGSLSAIELQHAGDWNRALLEYAAAERRVLDSDFSGPYPFIALRHAYLLAARGRADECERQRQAARAGAPTWADASIHIDGCVAGLLHLTSREFATAADVLDETAHIEERMGMVISGHTSRFADQFEAYWHLGRARELDQELKEFETAARRMAHPMMLAWAARCHALIAAPEEFDERFAAALVLHSEVPDVFEIARTRLLWGQRLRRVRRKADARRQLVHAQAGFERTGAEGWLRTCRSELAACGERRASEARPGAGPMATLTPREFEVAREVAGGATNAEASRRLFISQRTVEYHLSNAYRKLGVSDRRSISAFFT
jgi:DNA-binding CsgD family transcriptional regulator